MQQNPSKVSFISAVVGTVAAALCCFTPLLMGLLGLVGLSALTPYLDYVLLPAMVVLPIVAVISYRKWRRALD
jgi:mercuric ion transport protein